MESSAKKGGRGTTEVSTWASGVHCFWPIARVSPPRTIRVVEAELEAHVVDAALVGVAVRPNGVDAVRLGAKGVVVVVAVPSQHRLGGEKKPPAA